MAAIMRGRRTRRRGTDPITNRYVEDRGRRYRICRHGQHVMIVALKGKRFERFLDVDGRRARQLIKLDEARNG